MRLRNLGRLFSVLALVALTFGPRDASGSPPPEKLIGDEDRKARTAGLAYVARTLEAEIEHIASFERFPNDGTEDSLRIFLDERSEALRSSIAASIARLHVRLTPDAAGQISPDRSPLGTWYSCQYRSLSMNEAEDRAAVAAIESTVAAGTYEGTAAVQCQKAGAVAEDITDLIVGKATRKYQKVGLQRFLRRARLALSFYAPRFRAAAEQLQTDKTSAISDVLGGLNVADLAVSHFLQVTDDSMSAAASTHQEAETRPAPMVSILRNAPKPVKPNDKASQRGLFEKLEDLIQKIADPDEVSRFYPRADNRRLSYPDAPAVAMLLYKGGPHCTGTLIRSDTVLTAAHCFCGSETTDRCDEARKKSDWFKPENWRVYFQHEGIISAYRRPGPETTQTEDWLRIPTDYITFPKRDLALVRLRRPVTLIEPATVARQAIEFAKDVALLNIGFGVHHSIADAGQGTLLTNSPSMSLVGIKIHGQMTLNKTCEEGALCAEFKAPPARAVDTGVCHGDSGGPLFWRRDWTAAGEIIQVGVLSSIKPNGDGKPCTVGQKSSFVSLADQSNRKWVEDETGKWREPEATTSQKLSPVLNFGTRYRRAEYGLLTEAAIRDLSFDVRGENFLPKIDAITIGINAAAKIQVQYLGVNTDQSSNWCVRAPSVTDYSYAYACKISNVEAGSNYRLRLSADAHAPASADIQIIVTDHYKR